MKEIFLQDINWFWDWVVRGRDPRPQFNEKSSRERERKKKSERGAGEKQSEILGSLVEGGPGVGPGPGEGGPEVSPGNGRPGKYNFIFGSKV